MDELLAADERRRSAVSAADALRAEQKTISKQVPKASGEERPALLERAKALADEVKAAEAEQAAADAALRAAHLAIPNVVADGVPPGGEDDSVVLRAGRRRCPTYDFPVRDHIEIGELLGAIDIERGAKVCGARFYFLTGVGALLELALVNLAMAQAVDAGLHPGDRAGAGASRRRWRAPASSARTRAEVYRVERRRPLPRRHVARSRWPAYHADEILDLSAGPQRYAGFSSCFRREAGSYGKDTRGIIRVHWFDKVEMFTFCRPEEAAGRAPAAARVGEGVPPRRSSCRSGWSTSPPATSAPARPASTTSRRGSRPRARYRELTSTSNCTTFQARRLNIRYRDDERQAAGRRDAQRHAVRDRPHHRLPARGAPAGRRLGARAGGAAAVAGRPGGAGAGRVSAAPPAGRDRPGRHAGAHRRHRLPAYLRGDARRPRTPARARRSSPAGRRAGWRRSPRRPGTRRRRSARTARSSTTCTPRPSSTRTADRGGHAAEGRRRAAGGRARPRRSRSSTRPGSGTSRRTGRAGNSATPTSGSGRPRRSSTGRRPSCWPGTRRWPATSCWRWRSRCSTARSRSPRSSQRGAAGDSARRGDQGVRAGRAGRAGRDPGAREVVAFGDMPNDLPMLAWAGRGGRGRERPPRGARRSPTRSPRATTTTGSRRCWSAGRERLTGPGRCPVRATVGARAGGPARAVRLHERRRRPRVDGGAAAVPVRRAGRGQGGVLPGRRPQPVLGNRDRQDRRGAGHRRPAAEPR